MGSSGGRTPEMELTSYLVDERLMIDMGAATTCLSLEEQEGINDVLLTHAHLDHILGLAFLYENTMRSRIRPLDVYATEPVLKIVREHLFIPQIMQGYSTSPGFREGVHFHAISLETPFRVGRYEIEAFPVFHTSGSVAFRISDPDHTFLFSGDTGKTDRVWRWMKNRGGVDCLMVEVSFPNAMQGLADASRHLTPRTLVETLDKAGAGPDQRVYLVHLKPSFLKDLEAELAAIDGRDLVVLEKGDVIKLEKDRGESRVIQAELEERVADRKVEFESGEDLYDQRERLESNFGVNVPAGETIFSQGDNSKIMYVIQEGKVKVYRNVGRGMTKTLAVLGPGEFFGEMAMLNNRPRSATTQALTDVKLLAFDKLAFEKLVLDNFGVALRLIRTLAHRLQYADMLIENLLFIDPQSKVVNTLIQSAYEEGIDTKDGLQVRITPEELADKSGVVSTTLRDILAELVYDNLIVARRETIIIPDVSKLKRLLKFLELKNEFA